MTMYQPGHQPEIEVLACSPDQRDDGLMVLTLGRNTRAVHHTSDRELIVALDRHGNIAWQQDMPFGLMDCRLSRSNSLLVMGANGQIAELAPDGSMIGRWYSRPYHPDGIDGAIAIDTMKFHHSVNELPDNKLVTLSARLQPGVGHNPDWPDNMTDTVIIFDRQGAVEIEFALSDILDTDRHTHGHYVPYWPLQGWHGCTDWSHANSVTVDPQDGQLIISLRHQDAVIKVTRTGELVWILSMADGWRPPWSDKLLTIDGGRPFTHQHDAAFTADGALLLFDNGTTAAFPPTPAQPIEERQTFALGYRIDTNTMTATEVWRYGGDDLPYTSYVGGVTQTPNGNRFIACTGVRRRPDGSRPQSPLDGIGSVELIEVSPGPNSNEGARRDEVVFRARIDDPNGRPDGGWNGFRPQYLPVGFLTAT